MTEPQLILSGKSAKLHALSEAVVHIIDDVLTTLSQDDRALFADYLKTFPPEKQLQAIDDLVQLTWRQNPVPIRQFITDEEYLGLGGQIYERLICDLEELFSGPYTEAVFCGAIGWGKSSIAKLIHAYLLHQLGCMHNPARAFGLVEGSSIVLINLSINKTNAEEIVFKQVVGMVDRSPWFNRYMPRKREKLDHLEFENGVWLAPFAANEKAIVGFDAIGGIMDEVNEMAYAFNSVRKNRNEVVFDQAQALHDAIERRMESRFAQIGAKLPGIICAISSSKFPGEYTERREQEMQRQLHENGKTNIFFRRYTTWDTKRDKFSKTTFRVALGTNSTAPMIVTTRDQETRADLAGAQIMNVPDNLLTKFQADIHGSIRDFIGRPTAAIAPFFTRVDKIFDAFQRGKKADLTHPFTKTDLSPVTIVDNSFSWEKFQKTWDPTAWYFFHGDLAKGKTTGDKAGIALGRIGGSSFVLRQPDPNGPELQLMLPHFVIDMYAQIHAPPDDEIRISTIKNFLLDLKQRGVKFHTISFDQWNSLSLIQDLSDAHCATNVIEFSVDRNPEVYEELKDAFYEDRIDCYSYDILHRELSGLERDERTGKIDHPPAGCFSGDTRVSLLDGTEKSLRELAKTPNEPFYVYTMRDGKVSVGVAVNPRLTKKHAQTVCVELDNGEIITCTPEHRFMLRDGQYCEAEKLQPGMSLMPLYRRISTNGLKGYEQYLCPGDEKWHFTHRMVIRWAHPNSGYTANGCSGLVCHHKKGKRNNSPDALTLMTRVEHGLAHADDMREKRKNPAFEAKRRRRAVRYARSKAGRQKSRENLIALNKNFAFAAARDLRAAALGARTGSQNITKYNKSEKHRKIAGEIGKRTIWKAIAASRGPRLKTRGLKNHHWRADVTLDVILKILDKTGSQAKIIRQLKTSQKKLLSVLKDAGFSNWRDFVLTHRYPEKRPEVVIENIKPLWAQNYSARQIAITLKLDPHLVLRTLRENNLYEDGRTKANQRSTIFNHKVIAVKRGPLRDVYDISVPDTENFALSAGIFVHNSKDVSDALSAICYQMLQFKSPNRTLLMTRSYGKDIEAQVTPKNTHQRTFDDVLFASAYDND